MSVFKTRNKFSVEYNVEYNLCAMVLFSDGAKQGEKRLQKTDTDKFEKDQERLSKRMQGVAVRPR